MQRLTVSLESWPIAGAFTISRGSKTLADVVSSHSNRMAQYRMGRMRALSPLWRDCRRRGGGTEAARAKIEAASAHEDIPRLLEPKAARNALDCALWDLEAKLARRPVWQLLDLAEPAPSSRPIRSVWARRTTWLLPQPQAADRPLLKIKLGGQADGERLKAIRASGSAVTIDHGRQ